MINNLRMYLKTATAYLLLLIIDLILPLVTEQTFKQARAISAGRTNDIGI